MLLNCGVGEDSCESLDCEEIQPVSPKGNQSWIFIERTDAEAETPILWPPDVKNWLLGKDPDAGKDWRQKEMETTEDEMIGWHHRLDGREFEKAPGVVMDREAWHAAVHGVTESWTWLSDWMELKEVKDLYSKNCKMLMKEIKVDSNRLKCVLRLEELILSKWLDYTIYKAIYKFSAMPIKLPMAFLTELEEKALQIVYEKAKDPKEPKQL